MSSDVAIRVSGLSKCYNTYERPPDRLKQGLLGLFARFMPFSGVRARMLARAAAYARQFWALRNVTFEVVRGEVIGIIGRNGAGKSTLLQMICGTVTPSSGDIEVNGRVAALLELGAGFNPEFSGRENVFLNATILGLSRSEIEERFSEIVAFSELENFIDEPVKVYSSGMYVRLAFSVAVHVHPDILIVDEALSVGDIAFRNKCIEKIKNLVAKGVTILFVTHDLGTLQLLCSRVFWLDAGAVVASGDPIRVSQEYYVHSVGSRADGPVSVAKFPVQHDTGKARFTECRIVGESKPVFSPGDVLRFRFGLEATSDLDGIVFAISIYRADGDWLIGQTSREAGVVWQALAQGEVAHGELELTALLLAPGDYLVAFGAYSPDFSQCYGMTDVSLRFSVRADFAVWGKIIHPCTWREVES